MEKLVFRGMKRSCMKMEKFVFRGMKKKRGVRKNWLFVVLRIGLNLLTTTDKLFWALQLILREQNKMSLFLAKTRLFEVKHPLCKMLERSFFGRVPTFYTEDA